MAKYLNEVGLAHFWDNIKTNVVDKLERYILHQSDFHNNVIESPTIVHTFPAAPIGYYAQGFTIDSNGVVYMAYAKETGSGNAIVRKFSTFIGDGSELTAIDEITLSVNKHANSINIQNGKLLIADVGSNANKIAVVNISTFSEETSITLPYHGLNTAAYITDNGIGYIIGHMEGTNGLQMYEYDSDLSRPSAYADRFLKTPTAVNYSQGCCVKDGMYYQVYSKAPVTNVSRRSYIALFSPSSGRGTPSIFPIGLDYNEIEDIAIYNGHMYANSVEGYLWDFGTEIASVKDQYATTSLGGYWGDISFNKIGYEVTEYFTGNVVPKKIKLSNSFSQICSRMPERCMFRFRMTATGHKQIVSPWYPIVVGYVNERSVGQSTASTCDIYSLIEYVLNPSGYTSLEIKNLIKSSIASGYTQTLYPNFGVDNFDFMFRVLDK